MGQNNSTPSRSRRSRSLSQGQAHTRPQTHPVPQTHPPSATVPMTPHHSSPPGAAAAPPPSPPSPPPPPPPPPPPLPPLPPLSDVAAPHTAHSLPQTHVHTQPHVRPQPHPHYQLQQLPARVQNHMLQLLPQPQLPQISQQSGQTLAQTQPAQPSDSLTLGTAAIAPSRVVRSTTRRRRLLAAFYPLLSRNSSTGNNSNSNSNTNTNSGNNSNNYTSYNSNSNGGSIIRGSNDNNSGRARQVVPELRPAGLPPRHRQPERPHHTPTRSQTLPSVPSYPSSLNARTTRGLSRVQRRNDEQSIRSFRSSSSRSSSLLAIPASSSTAAQTAAPLYHQHVRQSLSQHQGQLSAETMEVDQDVTLSTLTTRTEPLLLPFDASHDLQTDHTISGQMINLGSRAVNMMSLGEGTRPETGLFVARSNPRVGTSISSSLLPIRPDSEDEDDDSLFTNDVYSHHRATEQEALARGLIRASSDTNSLHARYRSDAEQHDDQTGFHEILVSQRPGSGLGPRASTSERRPRASRPSRYPPPEIVADLIQRQIAQGIAEAAANRPSELSDFTETPPARNPSSTSLETVNSSTIGGSFAEGVSNPDSSTSSARRDAALEDDLFAHRSTGIHRRRLRSPSLRGLLGFQPMNGVTEREPVRGSGIDRGFSPAQHDEGERPEDFLDRRHLIESQLPFLTRLLSEIGRGLRGQQGNSVEGDQGDQSSSTLNPTSSATNEDASVTSESGSDIHSTADEAPRPHSTPSSGESPASEANTPPQPRRHAMVRFIQIGGGASLATFGANRTRSGSVESGQGSPRTERSEDSPRVGRDELADAILMFLSSPASGNASDAESSETISMDGGETPRARPRRPPWVVFTLSGAYLSSLLAGAREGGEEGGLNYDDLWMLSNMIGPARPITTTQEAIDSAGFHVGRFENASQGMLGVEMLGDGSKCLVCMSEYEDGEDMRALRCKHGFHQECIDKWLTTGANKCPVCRATAVVPPDTALPRPVSAEE